MRRDRVGLLISRLKVRFLHGSPLNFTRGGVELARCLIAEWRYDEAREPLKRVIDERQSSDIADWFTRHRPYR